MTSGLEFNERESNSLSHFRGFLPVRQRPGEACAESSSMHLSARASLDPRRGGEAIAFRNRRARYICPMRLRQLTDVPARRRRSAAVEGEEGEGRRKKRKICRICPDPPAVQYYFPHCSPAMKRARRPEIYPFDRLALSSRQIGIITE